MTRTFAAEADMLALIAAAAPELAGPGAVAVFEVPSAVGVPDVVAAVFNQDVIVARADTGFVTDPAGLAALLALSDALARRRALDPRQVAAAAGVTASYARSRVLPGLAARGLAVMAAPGRWTSAGPYRSPASTLVTIEAKLRDWRRGLRQAARHAAGADAAWLVLDGACTGRAAVRADWFRATGVGLAGLGQDGTLQFLLRPSGEAVLRARRELHLSAVLAADATTLPGTRIITADRLDRLRTAIRRTVIAAGDAGTCRDPDAVAAQLTPQADRYCAAQRLLGRIVPPVRP